MVIDM